MTIPAASPGRLRVVAADSDVSVRNFYDQVLTHAEHEYRLCSRGADLPSVCTGWDPDIVVLAHDPPAWDGIALAEACQDLKAAFLLVCDSPAKALAIAPGTAPLAGVAIKPWTEATFRVAIASARLCFLQAQALRFEAVGLRQALEERKLVERAKGALMRRLSVDEETAFRRMRSAASRGKRRMVEVAQAILVAEEAFSLFDRD